MRLVGARSEGHCSPRFAVAGVAYSEEPLVSSDFVPSPFSALFDVPTRLVELAAKLLVDQPVLAR